MNDFGCRITGNPDRLTINQIRAHLPESQLYSSMDATFSEPANYIISMEDAELELKDIAGLIDIPELDSSHVLLDCHIHGVPDNFNIELNLNGFVNQYPFEDFYIRGRYYRGNINLDEGKLVAWNNKFFFKGEMSGRRNYLSMRFLDFNVQDFVDLSPRTNLNGSLYTNLNQLSLNPLTGRGKLELVNSVIDTVDIDSLRFELKADHNNLEIVEPSFLKFASSARFRVKGNVDEKYMANLQLSTENLDLMALSQSLKIDTLRGNVDANLFITGNVFDPDIMGYVWVPHFEKDDIQLDSLILQIKIDQILSSRQGDAYFSMTNSQLGPLVFREARSDIIFDSNLVIIDTLFMANGANYISTSGQVIIIEDTTDLELKNFRIFYEQYWIDNSGPLIVHLDPQELIIEQAVFMAPDDGHLEIRGYWDREIDDVQAGLLVRNMHIKPLEQFAGEDILLSGVIEGDLSIYDLLHEPEIEIEIKLNDLYYNKVALGTIQSAFKFEDKKLYFDEFNLRHDSTRIDLDGDVVLELGGNNENAGIELFEKSQADLKLTWQNVNISNYMPLFKMSRPVKGIVNGEFKLSGTMKDPRGQIKITGEEITYDKFYIDSTHAALQFNRDLITLENLTVNLNGTLFSLTGTQEVNLDLTELDSNLVHMPLDLDLRCEDNTLEFIGFLTDQVERVHGPFRLDLKIRGTPANPRIDSGNLELKNGIIELSRVKNPITDVYLDADFDNGIMIINEFSGYSRAGAEFF